MADNGSQALRKRQQIQKAGKNMFLWVAGAAVILGVCVVLALSLFERISYRQTVINEKNSTVSTLKSNIEVAEELKTKIRVLNTNQALLDTPRLSDTEPVSVILDALPSTANSSALGASLQQNLLTGNGVTIESLTVNPVPGVEDLGDTGSSSSSGEETEYNQISFSFTVSVKSGQASVLQDMLKRVERSIRTINLTSVVIERQGSKITLKANGVAYYQPAVQAQLQDKTIPKGDS
jgi:hypothetical protein